MTPSPIRVVGWPAFVNRSLNPYTALLYESVAREGLRVTEFNRLRVAVDEMDILHLHWPDAFIDRPSHLKAAANAAALMSVMSDVRAKGGKIVWTVHNLASHDRFNPRLEKRFWAQFTDRLSGFIALSRYGRAVAEERFPSLAETPGFVVPHGHYREEYPRGIDRLEARRTLGIDHEARVILFFGRVRPYKGIMELIRAFSLLAGRDLALCIAGAPASRPFGGRVRSAAGHDARIHAHLGFVPRDKAQIFFAAADLVVLPYLEVLNSGAAMLALSFDRPVLLPRRGALVELQGQVGREWVETFADDLTHEKLGSAISWALSADRPQTAPLHGFEWPGIGRKTAHAYHHLLKTPWVPTS